MKYFFILVSLTIAKAGVIKESNNETQCEGVIVEGVYHDKQMIAENLDRPYMLSVDNDLNILFFSYSLQKNDDVFQTAKIELDSNEMTKLDIVNGFAQTVDQKTHDVYIGSSDGIYKYNSRKNEAEFFGRRGSDIWSIYFKDVLYYSEFPSQFLYTFIDGNVERFKDLEDTKVDHFIIDNDDVMFFTNATGLYSQQKGTKNAVLYEEFPSFGPRGISIDENGHVFLCLRDGIYKIDKESVELKKAADIDDCFGIAFDEDNNMIYADSTSIVRLKRNKKKSC